MPPYEPDTKESRNRRDLFIPLGFLVLAGILLILPMPVQQQVSTALRNSVLAPFIWTQEGVNQSRIRAGELSVLQAEFDSLVAVLSSQQTLAEENQRLRDLLELRQRATHSFVPASAIRPGTRGSQSMFLLDVGSVDGVEVNDPVVVAGGLIGVIREVGVRTSLAMDWTHPDFRVSVMTEDGTAFGIVEPRLGAFREDTRLVLSSVPYHTPVENDELVVTSGQGAVYPRGIVVGTIEGLAESEAGWRRSYWLEPAVLPGTATHVLVLTGGVDDDVGGLEYLWLDDASPSEGDPPGETGVEGVSQPAAPSEELPDGPEGVEEFELPEQPLPVPDAEELP
jgi:rod shape-determining protein MreC